MKKLITHNYFLACLIVLASSCSKQVEIMPSDKREPSKEEKSEILLLEKQSGITLFKRDIAIIDESGSNRVVMRFAAKDEAVLKEYLETYDFIISPVYAKNHNKRIDVEKNMPEPEFGDNTVPHREIKDDVVYTEVVSKKLSKDVIGVKTDFKVKLKEAGKVSHEPHVYTTEYYSEEWPEEVLISAGYDISFRFMGKSRWYTAYSTRDFCMVDYPYTCASHFHFSWGNANRFWIDGPYRVLVVMNYDRVTDFTIQFVNY